MQQPTRKLNRAEQLIHTGQRIAGHSPVFNMALAFTLRDVDQRRFNNSFARLSEVFAPLRTRLRNDGEQVPILVLDEPSLQTLTNIDLRHEVDAFAVAQRWMTSNAATPFADGELLARSALLRIDDETSIWFVNQHHLVADAWSCTLLLATLDRIYHEQAVADLDLAAWRQPSIASDDSRLQQARTHWRQVYHSVPQQDPIFGRRNNELASASERLAHSLNPVEVQQLQALANREFPTLSPQMSMFTVFAVLLAATVSRITQRQRIGFETPLANRATRRDRESPGLFIELFPVAVDIDGATTFLDLGRQVRAQLANFAKYGMPGGSDPAANQGCDAVLNFIPFTLGTFGGKPVSAEFVHSGAHDAAHALRLQVWDLNGDGGLAILFDLHNAVFNEANQATTVQYFKTLMESLVAAPDTAIAAIPLLSDEHRLQVVETFNATDNEPLPTRPTIQRIFDQARRTPTAIAVQGPEQQHSYAELVETVDAMAGSLLRLGIERGDRVCLSAPRSLHLLEAILAVMRVGATYVPVDPAYPAARRIGMYNAAKPSVLLTGDEMTDSAAPAGLPQIAISSLVGKTGVVATQALPDWPQLQLQEQAYILFTSGSTGAPKGVAVSQMGLLVYLDWALSAYADEQPLSMPLMTSIAFDLTVTSMFLPLLSGGTVHVYPSTSDAFDDALFSVVEDDRVNTIKLTPSHLRLLRRFDLHRSNVRNLIVGGEQLSSELAAAVERQFGDVRIFNEYGPTEAVVGCMIHQYRPADAETSGAQVTGSPAVPIGRPARHTRVYLLNPARQPVHPDVAGELYVHRAGAPIEYLDRPGATSEAFFPDFCTAGEVMYRTGDRARFNEHGDLVYLGRMDQQVKVAGHRVETEEIESALLQHPGIDACSVLLQQTRETSDSNVIHCANCGIGSDTPGVKFDSEQTCSLCRDFAENAERVAAYFRGRDELRSVIQSAASRSTGEYDCMVLLSGGKDSTYALYQVVAMGFKVYAFTLDNGYVSPQARANVQRVVDDLGIDHEFASTEHMPAIFRDSLSRFSNVCQGCFKTIYTLSLRRASELGIAALVTGLSRGQLFETRLNLGLFRGNRRDEEIDAAILAARKAYHRRSDAVTRYLGNDEFTDGRLLERIELIDFYRYWSASLDEMLEYLGEHAPWVRPSDTGRSTNCLINDVGIYVHRKERGFHNYALPYSWDVRLQQKDREQAVDELNDDIDQQRVTEILDEIDYQPKRGQNDPSEQLVAFYSATQAVDPASVKAALGDILPGWAIPQRFVQVDEIPLTINGKVDRSSLLSTLSATSSTEAKRRPETDAEEAVAEIWAELLPVREVGADDNFFEIGGTSIDAIEFMSEVCEQFAVEIPLDLIFKQPVLADIAAELESALVAQIERMSDAEVNAALGDRVARA